MERAKFVYYSILHISCALFIVKPRTKQRPLTQSNTERYILKSTHNAQAWCEII